MKWSLLVFVYLVVSFNTPSWGLNNLQLIGAGATFPYPFYQELFDQYQQNNNVDISYSPVGSGRGVMQLYRQTVDFAGTDAILQDYHLEKMPGEMLHIPTCLGAVAVTFNLPGLKMLNLNAKILGDIYTGKVTRWNDLSLKLINPGIKLPDLPIVVFYRGNASGTTFIFSDYLSRYNDQWRKAMGKGTLLNWPVGLPVNANEEMADFIQKTKGAIGYAELFYVMDRRLSVAKIQNYSKSYVYPSLTTVTWAADTKIPEDGRISLTGTTANKGYPLTSFSWILIYKEQFYNERSKKQAKALFRLLWWITHQGQLYSKTKGYAPLSKHAVLTVEKQLNAITYRKKSLF